MKKRILVGFAIALVIFCSLVLTNINNNSRLNIAEEKEPGILVVTPVHA